MKVILTVLALGFVSVPALADDLNCEIRGPATKWEVIPFRGKVANASSKDGMESTLLSTSLTIDGIKGTLSFSSISRFSTSADGRTHQTFDVGAFFYPDSTPTAYSKIAVRGIVSPSFDLVGDNVAANLKAGKKNYIWLAGEAAALECRIQDSAPSSVDPSTPEEIQGSAGNAG